MSRFRRVPTFRGLVIVALVLATTGALATAVAGWWARSASEGGVYTVDDVPAAPVVMVLGAQVYADGRPSPFLASRLDLARRLYESGKARAILVSGDGGQPEYNEVDPMRAWLIERGVPDEDVVGDYAGFDTWDSCSRARRVFGVDEMIVVTQSFHIERAVALCREVGIDTVGVGDEDSRRYERAWRFGSARERLATVKAMWDAWWETDPTFLGPHETGIEDALADD